MIFQICIAHASGGGGTRVYPSTVQRTCRPWGATTHLGDSRRLLLGGGLLLGDASGLRALHNGGLGLGGPLALDSRLGVDLCENTRLGVAGRRTRTLTRHRCDFVEESCEELSVKRRSERAIAMPNNRVARESAGK